MPDLAITPLKVVDLDSASQARIRRFQAAAQALNTSKAYQAQIATFERWATSHGHSALPPVAPAIVAAYITDRAANGASRSTINVALAAIGFGHKIAGHRFDAADPDLQRAVSGARREAVRAIKQAEALKPTLLGDMLATFKASEDDVDIRDAAMLALLYMAALRRSELSDIDFAEHGNGLAVLRLRDDGLTIELLRSKAAQERAVLVEVTRSDNPRGFAALERWVAHARITAGTPLFRQIAPRGGVQADRLAADGVSRAVKAAVRRYFLATGADEATAARLAASFSGHSGRVGFVVAAKEAGANDSDVAATTRHRSLEMIRRYGEQAEQKRRAAHRLAGVGL